MLGSRQLAEYDRGTFATGSQRLYAKGLAPATVHKAHQLLGLIMRAAVDARLIRSSPCYNIPLPRIEREETRFLAPAEVWNSLMLSLRAVRR
jgi:hypothetical protein